MQRLLAVDNPKWNEEIHRKNVSRLGFAVRLFDRKANISGITIPIDARHEHICSSSRGVGFDRRRSAKLALFVPNEKQKQRGADCRVFGLE